jgi:hypothetical protein
MKLTHALLAPLALVALTLPLSAQTTPMTDMSTMTCADLAKLDQTGMMQASDQHMMLSSYADLTETDRTAMDAKLGVTAEMDEMQKNEKILTGMAADHTAMMSSMTEEQKTAATKASEDHMAELTAACAGNDTMLLQDAIKG